MQITLSPNILWFNSWLVEVLDSIENLMILRALSSNEVASWSSWLSVFVLSRHVWIHVHGNVKTFYLANQNNWTKTRRGRTNRPHLLTLANGFVKYSSCPSIKSVYEMHDFCFSTFELMRKQNRCTWTLLFFLKRRTEVSDCANRAK